MRLNNSVPILFFNFLIFSCSQAESTYTIETVDGVKYVTNTAPLWGDEPKISLEFVQQIGGAKEKEPNKQFFRLTDLVCSKDGNIYILDSGNFRIQKFDSRGNFLLTVGKRGQGPGELMRPFGMAIDRESIVFVADTGNNRIQKFSQNGDANGSFRTASGTFRSFNTLRILKSGDIVLPFSPSFNTDNYQNPDGLIEIVTVDGETKKKFGRYHESGDTGLNIFVNATHFDSDSGDNIYVNFLYLNRIDKYSPDGEHLFTTDRPIFYEIVNTIEYETMEIRGELTKVPRQSLTLVSSGMGIDNKDRVWVITPKIKPGNREIDTKNMEPGDLFLLDVFNDEGILLARIPAPRKFNYLRVFGSRLFLFDNVQVAEYTIIEN